ncbi:MAG: DUF2237 domain-containing protein [Verrucomicrobiota bacterium]
MSTNVFGESLIPCSMDPITGYTRNGYCVFHPGDRGQHTVCAVMTDDFLQFSKSKGNDLTTAVPEYQFPGLTAGDQWCLCLGRWVEALEAGVAPQVVLEATHIAVLEFVDLEVLQQHALED